MWSLKAQLLAISEVGMRAVYLRDVMPEILAEGFALEFHPFEPVRVAGLRGVGESSGGPEGLHRFLAVIWNRGPASPSTHTPSTV
jgi:hypothetical protein